MLKTTTPPCPRLVHSWITHVYDTMSVCKSQGVEAPTPSPSGSRCSNCSYSFLSIFHTSTAASLHTQTVLVGHQVQLYAARGYPTLHISIVILPSRIAFFISIFRRSAAKHALSYMDILTSTSLSFEATFLEIECPLSRLPALRPSLSLLLTARRRKRPWQAHYTAHCRRRSRSSAYLAASSLPRQRACGKFRLGGDLAGPDNPSVASTRS